MRLRLIALVAGFAAVAGTIVAGPVARAADPPVGQTPYYVALGDSYTSAPLISRPVGELDSPENPYGCGKSDLNYPHLIARHLGLWDPVLDADAPQHRESTHPGFVDISCGAARSKHMWEEQGIDYFDGPNPPQFSVLERLRDDPSADVRLVSIGVGGNDLGFGELQDYCVQPPEEAGGVPCRYRYEETDDNGNDLIDQRLARLRTQLEAVVDGDDTRDGIRDLAPNAEILVYGYPALLPEAPAIEAVPEGCYPYIPILPTDAQYLRGAEKRLNAMIEDVATSHGAHYVDWYTISIGHDMCQPPGLAWVNGVVVVPPSFPVHPNALGTKAGADVGISVLETLGIGRADFE